MAISVHPDGRVEVRAPEESTEEAVLERLRKRRGWILKQKRFFAGKSPLETPRRYVSGASHKYLGRRYRLKIRLAVSNKVKLTGGYFWISTIDKSPTYVEDLLQTWLRKKAHSFFKRRASEAARRLKLPSFSAAQIRVKRMQRRWGSCAPSGMIHLNLELIRASNTCIDYVIVHELTHLKEPSHSKRFYLLLDKVLPSWRAIKNRLESSAASG
jgi:hypothetical protein